MKVYVVRHGESETNHMKKWTGWFDAPLTEKGRDDARGQGNFLKILPLTRFIPAI